MNKKQILIAALIACTSNAFAGGYLTNTNQSIYFLRNPARDASIGIDGVYYNPAGAAFLGEGFHLQFNWQNARQHRDAVANYGELFKYNYLNPAADGSRKFKGDVKVPIQPSLFMLYNKGDWSYQLGFGVMGGGGGCNFDDGVGMFEALVGSGALNALGENFGGYSLNSTVEGKSYNFGLTLAAARKLTDKLSISFGLRALYATNSYKGSITNMKYRIKATGTENTLMPDLELDCDQKGFGIAPIIGVDFQPTSWLNLAAKYEFRAPIKVKSEAHNNDAFNNLAATNPGFASYIDGAKTASDMPALLTLGAQISPIEKLRLNVGYHYYADLGTRQWSETNIASNTNEILFGAEYDINDKFEVSAGYQKTMFDQTEANYSDMNFNLSSYSFGFGVGYRVTEKIKVNVAYFQTIYDDHTKTVPNTSTTTYSRTNRIIGVGIDFAF